MPTGRSRRRLTALRRTRDSLASTEVLVHLARALAEVTTSPEAAQRIAEALPAISGCDQAAVLLPEDGRFVVRGASGPPDERQRLIERAPLGAQLRGRPVSELPVVLITRRSAATEPAASAMDELGIAAVGLVIVRVRGEVRALVTAEWYDLGCVPSDADLEPRLHALADQAAYTLGNAHLLDAARHQALHDTLTGLPNQALFDDRAAHAVTRARRNGERLAVGVLDLDRFKTVNDSLGHRAGDELLIEVAARLRAAVRGHDTVARMGGDEFTLLLPDLDIHGEAIVAERLLDAFAAPFVIDGHSIRMSPSIGLASFPDDGDTPERLLRSADAAMYRAKENGRNTWATYASGMREHAYDRLTLEADLHRALERHELRVGFQPVARVTDGSHEGFETLVRWSHPSFGLLGPGEFLPLAEEIGLVADLDGWVLRRACLELGRADAAGVSATWISVNVSPRTLVHPSLLRVVREALEAGGLTPDRLVVEITDAAAPGAADGLAALRDLGVRVAIDAFGRGHSPLAELADLPLDVLKIDRSFLVPVRSSDEEAPVLEAIVTMAHHLGLVVIADGVDSEPQRSVALRHGCDLVQGNLLGRAEPTLYAGEGASAAMP